MEVKVRVILGVWYFLWNCLFVGLNWQVIFLNIWCESIRTIFWT